MAHFNFVISQNTKWGHAGFYIDCHRMMVPENILLQKKHCIRAYITMSAATHAHFGETNSRSSVKFPTYLAVTVAKCTPGQSLLSTIVLFTIIDICYADK